MQLLLPSLIVFCTSASVPFINISQRLKLENVKLIGLYSRWSLVAIVISISRINNITPMYAVHLLAGRIHDEVTKLHYNMYTVQCFIICDPCSDFENVSPVAVGRPEWRHVLSLRWHEWWLASRSLISFWDFN